MLFFWSWITTSKMNSSSGSNASSRFFFDSQVKNSISLIEKKPSEYKGMMQVAVGVSKNTEKPIKPRKLKKKKPKKLNREKKPIKLIWILKKPTGLVRFRFYKPETEKTEPNRPNWKNRANPSQTRKNRAKLVWTSFCSKKTNRTEPKPVGLNRFRFGFGFFKKKSVWLLFFIKTKPNWKWSPLNSCTIEVIVEGRILYQEQDFHKLENW